MAARFIKPGRHFRDVSIKTIYLITGDPGWPFHGHPQPMVPIPG